MKLHLVEILSLKAPGVMKKLMMTGRLGVVVDNLHDRLWQLHQINAIPSQYALEQVIRQATSAYIEQWLNYWEYGDSNGVQAVQAAAEVPQISSSS